MRIAIISIFIFLSIKSSCQSEQFITPIDGEYMHDFFIVNYVDWQYTGFLDHSCGTKSYDGHQGTDFVIRNFSQMDSGVYVFAADDGVVTFVLDTLFDRNKTAISGGFGNYICIKHDNLFYTYYAHLKKYSALVHAGDSVHAGDTIGMVGSSGYTSDPHLHFEVWYDSLYNWDPFSGVCGNPETLWIEPLPYENDFGIIDYDCNNFIPTLDTLKERLPSQKTFTYPSDSIINFWMQGYGVLENDVSEVKWITPDGFEYYTYSYTHTTDWWYYYFWCYIPINEETQPGIWKIQYIVNDEVKIEDSIEVLAYTPLSEVTSQQYFIYTSENGNIILRWKEAPDTATNIYLYDIAGRVVFEDIIPPFTQQYEISNTGLTGSVYFIKIDNYKTSKLILHSEK